MIIQRELDRQWEQYLFDTINISESPQSMRKWWSEYLAKSRSKALYIIVNRALKQPRGGCDVQRSFIPYSNLMRSSEADARPTMKEVRVMG